MDRPKTGAKGRTEMKKCLRMTIAALALVTLSAGPATAQTSADDEFCRYLANCGSLDCKIMEWILC